VGLGQRLLEGAELMVKTPSIIYRTNKRILVTDATGTVGSWLTKWLVDAGAHTAVRVADAGPQSELIRSGDIARVSVMNGLLESYDDVDRA
jgi:CDP-glucose 4,6-dehydratase